MQVTHRTERDGAVTCDGHGGARGRRLGAQVVEPPDHVKVLPAGEVLIDRGVLAGQADDLAYGGGVALHVVPALAEEAFLIGLLQDKFPAEAGMSQEEEDKVKERLKALGYMD